MHVYLASSIFALISSLSLLRRTAAQEVTTDSVRDAFTQAKVVPDVISSFEPTGVLEVFFTEPGSSQRIHVTPGMNLTRSQTSSPPVLGISNLPPSFVPQTFAVALIDPDAPNPQSPSSAQFLHFLGGDFSLQGELTETTPALANQSRAVMEYTGPNPPSGSPPHRYVLLVYNQNTLPNTETNFSTTSAPFVNSSTPRNNFNISRFAQVSELTGPVAGTFFFVAPDGGNSSTNSSSAAQSSNTGSSSASNAPASHTNSALGNFESYGVALGVALALLVLPAI